jgi:hypothetical protein
VASLPHRLAPPAGGSSLAFQAACIALATGAVAYAVALLWLPSCLIDGEYRPMGMDSFYHARRILDAVAEPAAFYQFDPLIHAPEGSWVTWPWAYDLLLAWLVRGLQAVSGAGEPMALLAFIPPSWAFINAALLIAVGAALGLRAPALLLLGACFALSPLTQLLHGIGMLDHHYVELTFVLLTLLAGIRWLQAPAAAGRAVLLGAVLGIAPAFHNGLFALQLPVAAALLALWLRGALPPPAALRAFAASLALLTPVAALPSEPFRLGHFSFATQSWFHVYVAALTAAGVLYLAWRPWSWPRLAAALVLGAAALLPLARDAGGGTGFLTAGLEKLHEMGETAGLARQIARDGLPWTLSTYSGLLLLLPVSAALAGVLLFRRASAPAEVYFALFTLFGIALLATQLRLHYFGSFALALPPLLALQRAADARPVWARRGFGALAVAATAAALVPAVARLRTPVPPGFSIEYGYTRSVYPALAQACREQPGIVLADNNDGHHIRYHTDCAVIANNFILTPQHQRKLREAEALLSLSARELADRHPEIDYVLVRRDYQDLGWPAAQAARRYAGLRHELLFASGPLPPEFRLVYEVLQRDPAGPHLALARVFRIERSPAPTSPGDKG